MMKACTSDLTLLASADASTSASNILEVQKVDLYLILDWIGMIFYLRQSLNQECQCLRPFLPGTVVKAMVIKIATVSVNLQQSLLWVFKSIVGTTLNGNKMC